MFFGLSVGYAQEQIKGEPKFVQIVRQEFLDEAGNPITTRRYVQQETEYRKDGKAIEGRIYRPDGKLSYRDLYEYDEEGRLANVRTLDNTGTQVRVQTVYRKGPGIEEVVAVGSDRQELSRTTNKRDEAGRLLESTVIEKNDVQAFMGLRYDNQGHAVEAQVTLHGGQNSTGNDAPMSLRIDIAHHADNRVVMTWYGPDGSVLSSTETSEDEAGQLFSRALVTQGSVAGPITTERIDSQDSEGNWNQKTILVQRPGKQNDQPSAVLYRTTTYH